MEVKCKKITCGFNQSTICMAKEITVDSKQGCKSFTNKSKEKQINNNRKFNQFEVGEELIEYMYCPNKSVNCSCTSCRFNENKECVCNGITLSNGDKTAMCVSHIEK